MDPASISPAGLGVSDARIILMWMGHVVESIHEWEPRADSAVSVADSVLKHTGEQLGHSRRLLCLAQSRLHDDTAALHRSESDLVSWKSRVVNITALAAEAMRQAEDACQRASQAIAHWETELASARAWLSRAQSREAAARIDVQRAENALSDAHGALQRAETELSAARGRTEYAGTDSQGRAIYKPVNIGPYKAAVESAKQEVCRCEGWLIRAREELSLAIADREAAEARVAACEGALRLAHRAAESGSTALNLAQNAQGAAQRAKEEHQQASLLVSQAQQAQAQEQASITGMEGHVRDADTRQNEAVAASHHVRQHHAAARHKSTQGRLEIQWRADRLRAFDAPLTEI